MKCKTCSHHTQYAEPGRPMPCADPQCAGSPPGNGYVMARIGSRGAAERALFVRVRDDDVIVWRQETPWAREIDWRRMNQGIITPEGGSL